MDAWTDLFKEYLPEENVSADSYYEIQKLVNSLGLPSQMIDVYIDNCMIYWEMMRSQKNVDSASHDSNHKDEDIIGYRTKGCGTYQLHTY